MRSFKFRSFVFEVIIVNPRALSRPTMRYILYPIVPAIASYSARATDTLAVMGWDRDLITYPSLPAGVQPTPPNPG